MTETSRAGAATRSTPPTRWSTSATTLKSTSACAAPIFVHQRAWEIEDEGKVGPTAFVRDSFRTLRAEVMRRGWHQNRFIGGKLRWLGKFLP